MEINRYCLNDFDICEEHNCDYFKVKSKKDSQFYYIKKYSNRKLDEEKIETLKNRMFVLSKISNLQFFGLFEEDKGKEKDIYLIFEFFDGKLVCNRNDFQNYEIWAIAEKLLEIFEKLSEKGVIFQSNNNNIDVFEINLNSLKINAFDLINNNLNNKKENNKILIKNGNNEILFNIGIILEKIIKENKIYKGFINDLKNSKIDILTAKTQFKLFLRYSLYFDNIKNEIINYKEMLYTGSLIDGKPNGIGVLVNENGLVYQGEFKEGEIVGNGKMYIYQCNKNIGNIKDSIKNKNLEKIFEGTFINGVKEGKFKEYNKNHLKIFEGEFKNDIKNGRGIEYSNGNKIYEGEFKDDLKDGKGVEYKNGNKMYEGDFKEGKKNGIGIFYNNQSNKIYEGNFENNYFNGKGTLFYNDGKIQYQGTFKNGIFWEEGFYYNISGEKTKIINGLPFTNKQNIDNFKIYYSSGKILLFL